MKKKLILLTLVLVLVLSQVAVAMDPIKITLNGEEISTDVDPIIVNDRTLVPIRFISEELNFEVDWIQEEHRVTVEDGEHFITLVIDVPEIVVNDETIKLDVAPILRNDRTLVPLRAISEALGVEVDWDNDTRTVILIKDDPLEHLSPEEKEYVLEHQVGLTKFLNAFEHLQNILNKDFENLSRKTIEREIEKVDKLFIEEIRRTKEIEPPERFKESHKFYLQTLANAPELIDKYKAAYLENDKEAAKELLATFTHFNIKGKEATDSLKAAIEGIPYEASEDIKEFNKKANETDNLFNDDTIQKLLDLI